MQIKRKIISLSFACSQLLLMLFTFMVSDSEYDKHHHFSLCAIFSNLVQKGIYVSLIMQLQGGCFPSVPEILDVNPRISS